MFFKTKKSSVDWIIAGLGNPGKKYDGTRHNVGFAALDFAAEKWDIPVKRVRFEALCGEGRIGWAKVLLLKPQTFMNLSGQSLAKACDYYKVGAQNLLVLMDDISLEPGVLRIRLKGSAGGHNGIKSIIDFAGQDFPRIKIGVGAKPHPEYNLADWVLSRFSQQEQKAIAARYDDIAVAAEMLLAGKTSEAMSRFNGTA